MRFVEFNLVSTEPITQDVDSALTEYEAVCSDAADAGVDIVTKEYSYNWDYIQSCFFALTILTTIGKKHGQNLDKIKGHIWLSVSN